MVRKSIIIGIIILFILVVLVSNVSAHKWACLSYGDHIPYYTCHFTHCKLCLDDKGYSTSFGYCDKAKLCSFGPVNNDTTPPVLTINSPKNNFIYNTSKILFNLSIDEPSTIFYKNNLDSNGKFKMLAGNRLNYINGITFKDGFYNITIRAEDRSGNDADILRIFYVDTKNPKVDSPSDDKNGILNIKFEEANPVLLTLRYGNNKTGYGEYNINLNNCNKTSGDKFLCKVNISDEESYSMLKSYDGQIIELWIELKDIPGNIGKSKIIKGKIDITKPVINNPDNMFTLDGKNLYFNMSITDQNLVSVYYAENSTKLQWKLLCSSLKNGFCQKKVAFNKGNHDILVQVVDIGKNVIYFETKFTVN